MILINFSFLIFFHLEQDKGLDSLGEIITRQKYMAQGISSEIDLQNGKSITCFPLHLLALV